MAYCDAHTHYDTACPDCRTVNRARQLTDTWQTYTAQHAPIEIACCGQFRPLTGPDWRTPCCGRDWFTQEVAP